MILKKLKQFGSKLLKVDGITDKQFLWSTYLLMEFPNANLS